MRRAIRNAVSHSSWWSPPRIAASSSARSQIVAERGTAEQKKVCDQLWAGGFERASELRHYYDVMGPMYARKFDPAPRRADAAAAASSPEALNRAFAPGRVHGHLRPAAGAQNITAPTLILGRPPRLDLPAGVLRGDPRLIPGSRLRIFEESSHSMRVDAPERLFGEIMGFVAG